MALNKKPTFVNQPFLGANIIDTAAGVDPVNIITGGPLGCKVVSLFASGEETASRDLIVQITRGAMVLYLWVVTVPEMSGREAATPPVDLFTTAVRDILPKDADNQPYLFLRSEDLLQVALTAGAVTAAEQMSVMAVYGEFTDEEI